MQVMVGKQAAAQYQSDYLTDEIDPHVLSVIGYNFLTGEKLIKSKSLAIKWWQKAADGGSKRAQANLARLYFLGDGVELDYERGNELLELSIAQDYWFAYSLKAWCHDKGTCEAKSDTKALFYFIKAALGSNDGFVHSYIGYYYLKGRGGLEKSLERAKFHYSKAADFGLKGAKKQLAALKKSSI